MIPEVDFLNKAFRENPHEKFTELRHLSPLAKVKGVNAYLLTRHKECEALLKDERVSLDVMKGEEFPIDHPMQGYFKMREGLMLFANPPRHKDLRAPASHAMGAKAVKRYEPIIRELAEDAVKHMKHLLSQQSSIDFVKDISLPFVSKVICKVVGMSEQDHSTLAGMTQRVADGLDPFGSRHSLEDAGKAYAEFQTYMTTELSKGRWKKDAEQFSESFLGEIAQCPHMLGGFKNSNNLISTTVMLLSAGHLTTNHSLSLSMESFLSDEKIRPILSEASAPISPLMLEELFRFHCPAQITRRTVNAELKVGDKTLHAGQAIWLALVSANRDERIFQGGQELDLKRRPNPHLSFGSGIHFCLGAHLARLQLRVFLETIQGEFPALSIAKEGAIRDNNLVFRGLKTLPLQS